MVYQTISPKNAVPISDDAARILRDCRTLYLKQLGQLLQEAERVPLAAVQAFQQSVGDYFDDMVSSNRSSGFDIASDLTASHISLVGDSDLELEIRLGEFSARLMESTGGDLWRVYLRFVTLLNRPDFSAADNPVGPKGIALGLIKFCEQLGKNHEQTMARVDRLEIYFSRYLTVLYDALNNLLAERHVEAAAPSIISAPDSSSPHTASSAAANPAAALQRSLLGPNNEFFASASGPLTPAMQARLLARLDDLEKSGKLTPTPQAALSLTATHPSLEALIPGLFTSDADDKLAAPQTLNSSELGIPIGSSEAASIDALALIFETIFASTFLPEAVKAALSSLQIPMLKAALLDPGFFTASAHPARQLLDKIARAALGLPPEVPAGHPVCSRILAIASRARSEFTNDIQVFERQVSELNTLIAERDKAVAHSAEAYLPLLHQVERHTQATRRCRQVIEQHLTQGAPASMAEFLRTYWQKVLLVIWMENGEQSTTWQEHIALIRELLWSAQPKVDMEERKQLAKMLQPMLHRLNTGMARINMPEAVQAAFLDTCFALQTAAMRGAVENAPAPAKETPPEPANPAPAFSELSSGNLLLKIFDHAVDLPGSARLRPPPIRPASWLLLSLPETPLLCGRLCTGSLDSKLLLVANPDWGYALAIHPNLIDSMLATGSARVCSNDSLFDSAAKKAMLRTAKP